MRKMVWIERDPVSAQPIRIFRSKSAAMYSEGIVRLAEYATSVTAIRHQIFLRSKGECEICATPITESSGHLHEKQHRGKGGEVSLENSIFICPPCHRHQHADRNPHWSKK
jgi:5-methylcytosine-specific restriction endonuclease McrA